MTTSVDLCNLALDQIAARTTIVAIDPPTPTNSIAAQVAARNYQMQVEAVFQSAHWNSARRQKKLFLLKAAMGTPENPSGDLLPRPPIPWRYEYAYPPDCLQMRFVIPTSGREIPGGTVIMTNVGVEHNTRINAAMPFVPAIDLDDDSGEEIKIILTNARHAEGVYTGRIDNIDLWGAALRNAVVGTLAAWFCLPVTGDKALMGMRVQLAVGLINAARQWDGNEGITSSDIPVDWMDVRAAGGWFGDRFGAGPFHAGWAPIAMPNGISY
jgi:hypothetical protein